MTAAATAPEAPAAEEGTAGGDQQLISRGEEVYATNCASCHQLGGEGSSAYPALTNSNLLTAEDPTEAIRIVLQGRGQMPAFEDTLSTEAIAAVLSYERNAWDNNASIVTVAQVRQVRQGGSATEAGQTTTGETEGDTIQAASEGEPTPDNTLTPAGEVTDAASAPAEAMTPTAVMTASQAVTRSADIQQISATQEAIVATLVAITVEPAATATMTATMTAAVTDAPSAEATPSPPATEVEGTPSAPAQNAPIQAAPSDGQALIDQGERLYAINCASCHQLNGQGTNVYPALNNNQELTSEDPTQAIQIVLYGRGQMPAFADILSAEEVAAVLSYERNAWDNNASIVTVEQVNQVQQGDAATAAGQPTEDTGIAPTTDEGAVATATGTATAMLSPTAAMTPTRTAIPSPAGAVELPGAAGGVSPPLTWTPPPVISPTAAVTATAAMTAPTPANGAPTQSLTAEATSVPATPSPPAANNTTPQAAAAGGNQALINMGEEIYASECASCHQVNGEGSSVYPALNNSELLTAEDPTQAIQLVLQGRGQMPGFAETLSTEEIAAVLSYERNSWDNNASPVTVKEVEQVQAADGN
jgi:mono/diheme cytochrome c family protein